MDTLWVFFYQFTHLISLSAQNEKLTCLSNMSLPKYEVGIKECAMIINRNVKRPKTENHHDSIGNTFRDFTIRKEVRLSRQIILN